MHCGSGSSCVTCTGSSQGDVCLAFSNVCGCNLASDCPTNQACTDHTCSTDCTETGECNGGCCDGTTCQPGTSTTACGSTGGMCNECTCPRTEEAGCSGAGTPEGAGCTCTPVTDPPTFP
jgi:hypothetical protein